MALALSLTPSKYSWLYIQINIYSEFYHSFCLPSWSKPLSLTQVNAIGLPISLLYFNTCYHVVNSNTTQQPRNPQQPMSILSLCWSTSPLASHLTRNKEESMSQSTKVLCGVAPATSLPFLPPSVAHSDPATLVSLLFPKHISVLLPQGLTSHPNTLISIGFTCSVLSLQDALSVRSFLTILNKLTAQYTLSSSIILC